MCTSRVFFFEAAMTRGRCTFPPPLLILSLYVYFELSSGRFTLLTIIIRRRFGDGAAGTTEKGLVKFNNKRARSEAVATIIIFPDKPVPSSNHRYYDDGLFSKRKIKQNSFRPIAALLYTMHSDMLYKHCAKSREEIFPRQIRSRRVYLKVVRSLHDNDAQIYRLHAGRGRPQCFRRGRASHIFY